MFGVGLRAIKDGVKYLGFQLKAKGYSKADWKWLIDRFYKRISAWQFRCLSLAGRIVLTRAVLSQLAVYWAHIFFLPASIVQKMNKISANFIWGGNKTKGSYHLTALDKISRPKSAGGWGLLDSRTFGKALLCKSLWRGIFGEGSWSNIIKVKYMRGKGLEYWYRLGRIGTKYGSAIWLSFRKLEKFFLKHLKWCLQSGSRILIGVDPILSGRERISILEKILLFLHYKGFFTWDKLIVGWHGPHPTWKSADDLGLPQSIKCLWTPVCDAGA